jgi:hypothetical protein
MSAGVGVKDPSKACVRTIASSIAVPKLASLSRPAEAASVESIVRTQAFDGSFTPTPALIKMLTKNDVLSPQPAALEALSIDMALKVKLWCTMIIVAFLKTNFAEEEDAWWIIVDKSNTWIEDALRDVGMEDNQIKTVVEDARAAAPNAISKLKP